MHWAARVGLLDKGPPTALSGPHHLRSPRGKCLLRPGTGDEGTRGPADKHLCSVFFLRVLQLLPGEGRLCLPQGSCSLPPCSLQACALQPPAAPDSSQLLPETLTTTTIKSPWVGCSTLSLSKSLALIHSIIHSFTHSPCLRVGPTFCPSLETPLSSQCIEPVVSALLLAPYGHQASVYPRVVWEGVCLSVAAFQLRKNPWICQGPSLPG